MDIFYFILIIVILIAVIILLRRSDTRTKNKYRKAAYSLLEKSKPDPKELKDTIKYLRLYGGRWRKDKEFLELAKRLIDKLDSVGNK